MLPKIPYSMEKNKSESVPIGTLNLSCNFKPGDIAYSRGISLRKYPYLCTKWGDRKYDISPGTDGWEDSHFMAMAVFNEKIVTINETKDKIDGEFWHGVFVGGCLVGSYERPTVSEYKFAVLNDKLIIYPTKHILEEKDGHWELTSLYLDTVLPYARFGTNYIQYDNSPLTLVKELRVGDVVTLSGCSFVDPEEDSFVEPEEDLGINNNISFMIAKIEDGKLYASADIFAEGMSLTQVRLRREYPDLDYFCEKDNRLYGVCNADKTIYVSALGDPLSMKVYEGISTDSFAVAVGGDGDFTGCCKYGDSVLFFKENMLYKLTGSYPAEFMLTSYTVAGIAPGSYRSAVVIDEVLYYHGRRGFYAYTGGVPTLISENLGEEILIEVVAGSNDGYYYASGWSLWEDDFPYLLLYDVRRGIWLLEGRERVKAFFHYRGDFYKTLEFGECYEINDEFREVLVSNHTWEVQFVPFYETMSGKKIYSRLFLRCEIPNGSYMIVEVRCDGGEWHEVEKLVGKPNVDSNKIAGLHCGEPVGEESSLISLRLPIARCDKFELRLRGKGKFTLLDILREYHVGSEV